MRLAQYKNRAVLERTLHGIKDVLFFHSPITKRKEEMAVVVKA